MNRIKTTFEQICDLDNIKLAIFNASRRKRNRPVVQKCLKDIDKTANGILQILQSPRRADYLSTGTVERRKEGANKKERLISKPRFFPDQIIHWAVMQVLSPELAKRFYPHTYASIPGRGTHKAVRAMNGVFKKDVKGTKYCLHFDVHHAYDSVDKALLVERLSRVIKDPRVVDVLRDIIYSYTLDGLPKGFYPSAWLFNLFLTPLESFIKQDLKVKYLFVYMDNFEIYGGNKRYLARCRDKIFAFLHDELKLKEKGDYQIYLMPYAGQRGKNGKERRRFTDFVGFKIFRYKTEIRGAIFLRLRRCMLRLARGEYTVRLARAFWSYWGYVNATNTVMLRQKYIDGKINLKKLKEIVRYANSNQNASYVRA